MLGARIVIKQASKGEPEKPFWISYADLMTALMVLFLVAMSVTLLAVTKTVDEGQRLKAQGDKDITELLPRVEAAASKYPGVRVYKDRNAIDFGDRARFDKNSS